MKLVFGFCVFMAMFSFTICFEAAIEECKKGTSFVVVDSGFTHQELVIFQEIDVGDAEYSRFGGLECLEKEISTFFMRFNKDVSCVQKASSLINRLVQSVVQALHAETAWVLIRTSTPHDEFKVPRWHVDGYYYKPYERIPLPKFVMTFKGPQTQFYDVNPSERDILIKNIENRDYLAKIVDAQSVSSPSLGQGAFFVFGDIPHAAVHSEPHIDSGRIFLAIVAGSEKQIQDLKKRFKR